VSKIGIILLILIFVILPLIVVFAFKEQLKNGLKLMSSYKSFMGGLAEWGK